MCLSNISRTICRPAESQEPSNAEDSGETDCDLRHAGQVGDQSMPQESDIGNLFLKSQSAKRMGEPRGKQMGQKNAKRGDPAGG